MKQSILKQYKAVRTALNKERAKLQTRLADIQAVLGGETAVSVPAVEAKLPGRRKRRVSAANRAAVSAAAKARWAAYRAKKAGKATPKPARKAKKHFSAAARASMAAAAKARWVKAKAAGKSRL
jgi:hypothetical protein